jgi:hypothetical protein
MPDSATNPRPLIVQAVEPVRAVLVAGLAASFNFVALVLLMAVVLPKLDTQIEEISKSRAVATEAYQLSTKNYELIEKNWRELDEHRATIRRLNHILDMSAREAEEKLKRDKEKKGKE